MARSVIVLGAECADESAVLFNQEPAASIAGQAAEPRPLPLPTAEGPLLLELNNLCLAIEGNSDLGSTQAADADDGVIFQELTVLPFPPPSSTRSES